MRKFLASQGLETWAQYRAIHDNGINNRANDMKMHYHGYKYMYVFDDVSHYAYSCLYDHGPGGNRYGYMDVYEWMQENCKDTGRLDIHRVMKEPSTGNEWHKTEIGGTDYFFAVFKNEEDYIHFLLRWS